MLQHLHKVFCRAVENGDFNGGDVDVDVVNPAGVDGGKQMLGGGEQNAWFHEARGIADVSDVVRLRFDGEIVQVNAAKHDTGIGGGRHQADMTVHAGVEAHTFGRRLRSDGCLEHYPQIYSSMLLANVSFVYALLSTGYRP